MDKLERLFEQSNFQLLLVNESVSYNSEQKRNQAKLYFFFSHTTSSPACLIHSDSHTKCGRCVHQETLSNSGLRLLLDVCMSFPLILCDCNPGENCK